MFRWLYSYKIDFTAIIVIGIAFYFISFSQFFGQELSLDVPNSFQQLNTIFLSILIEAIPFVLIGVLIAGFIQIFITEEHIRRWIPENKFFAVVMSCIVGAFFPACECGIVPIVRRLIKKGVPLHAGIGFLLTGPLINPIVILSTYMAFGNDIRMASLRMGVGFVAALFIALIISQLYKTNQLKHSIYDMNLTTALTNSKRSFIDRLIDMIKHSIDEFFDMGKYLIIGAFIAASVQTYVSAKSLFLFGEGLLGSSLVMMGLAFILSLCSEADAFIGASFRNLFPSTSILAFLVYGPMIDLKNTIMLLSVFKVKFVLILVFLITLIVFICVNLSSLL
ncbi:permease [Alkalihalobacillus sp. AL-G]|uniref:permease n=1 Tax=Alkalihalobacillus sp. AL-G TaxID=2926399 RepID=UPI00272A1965|nr:permease [Alkalihalobacillus sp. AL-G]WLD92952.1 permease [Alkalihalobacillus sp. AL-G]